MFVKGVIEGKGGKAFAWMWKVDRRRQLELMPEWVSPQGGCGRFHPTFFNFDIKSMAAAWKELTSEGLRPFP